MLGSTGRLVPSLTTALEGLSVSESYYRFIMMIGDGRTRSQRPKTGCRSHLTSLSSLASASSTAAPNPSHSIPLPNSIKQPRTTAEAPQSSSSPRSRPIARRPHPSIRIGKPLPSRPWQWQLHPTPRAYRRASPAKSSPPIPRRSPHRRSSRSETYTTRTCARSAPRRSNVRGLLQLTCRGEVYG